MNARIWAHNRRVPMNNFDKKKCPNARQCERAHRKISN
nr:MAG TPA: hypothetical protein [Caudoviricetes sp.]